MFTLCVCVRHITVSSMKGYHHIPTIVRSKVKGQGCNGYMKFDIAGIDIVKVDVRFGP